MSQAWTLKRNCALSPACTLAALALPAVVTGTVAVLFWWRGFGPVAAFVALQWVGLMAAFVVYARHARDGDVVVLDGDEVRVEQRCGERVQETRLPAAWLQVEAPDAHDPLVRCRCAGRSVRVGAQVRAPQREAFARQLRQALRQRGEPA